MLTPKQQRMVAKRLDKLCNGIPEELMEAVFPYELIKRIANKLQSSIKHRKAVKSRVQHDCWFCKRVIKAGQFCWTFEISLDPDKGHEIKLYACYGDENSRACEYLTAVKSEPDD